MIINSKILLVENNVRDQKRPSNRVATVLFHPWDTLYIPPHRSSNSMKINAIQGEKSVIKSPL